MLRYPPLSAENYIRNRAAFADALSPGAMALFSSNDVYPTSADGTLPFRQDSNMLHLTGVDQEETVLLSSPTPTIRPTGRSCSSPRPTRRSPSGKGPS